VNEFLRRVAERVAPRTLSNVRTLRAMDQQFDQGPARFISYEREIWALRRDVDELRRDNRRVAELYDAVFEWAKANADARGVTPPADSPATVDRIAREVGHPE
jgi:hypothetical protein